jgi:hypothetical protein
MDITITYERPEEGPRSGPVTVGWLRDTDKGGVIYDPPERLSFRQTNKAHSKSASRCPAVIQMESRYFVVKCPFDIHIGFQRDEKGQGVLVNRAGIASPIQLMLPYIFIADEPVYVTQLGTFAHYRPDPLPGTIFGGRFPINLWPRPLMWAFEWHEPGKDIRLQRGEPLFYVQFEADQPERPISLVEAERTPELGAYLDHISGAVNYVNQTFSLFRQAEQARPKQLLKQKER